MNTFKFLLPITYMPNWYADFLLDLACSLDDASFNQELSLILTPLISFDSWKACLKYYSVIYAFDDEYQVPGFIGKHLHLFGEEALLQELFTLNCSWSCMEMIIKELLCAQSCSMRAISFICSFYYSKKECLGILQPFLENEVYRYRILVLLSGLSKLELPVWLRQIINEMCVSYHLGEIIIIDEFDAYDLSLPIDFDESSSYHGEEFAAFVKTYNYHQLRRFAEPSFLVVLAQAIHLAIKHCDCRSEIIEQIRYDKQHTNLRNILSLISDTAINNL